MDRRSFVSLLTAGAAGQAFVAAPAKAQAATPKNFVVIGGGMAGATAAKYLAMWASRSAVPVTVTLVDQNASYTSCILSNQALTAANPASTLNGLKYGYTALQSTFGITFRTDKVTGVDTGARLVSLDSGATLTYDRLVIAPGVDFVYDAFGTNIQPITFTDNGTELTGSDREAAIAAVPHAWKAGQQTLDLASQLAALQDGQNVILTIPAKPYRCPPGPYERVCAIADWLKTSGRPNSRVIVLDANTGITAEPKNFGRAFNVTHTNVDYYPNATVASVEMAGPNGNKVVTLKAAATLTNPNPDIVPTEYGASADSFEAAVVNLIPPQRAGSLLFEIATANSLSGAFDATGRWASIDELSYEWKAAPGVHIVGDSIASAQPKAGHIGNQEAKVCADAILRLETGLQPYPAPVTNSACFTPITATTATWLTAIFGYDPNTGKMAALPPGIMEAAAPSTEAYESMSEWFSELMADTFR